VATGSLLNPKEEEELVALIGALEKQTTGEIRIHVAKHVSRHGPIADATRVFRNLKMDATRERNAVLVFVGLKPRKLACIGDQGIHKVIGDKGWQSIVDEALSHFKKGDFYLGLHHAVETLGKVLKEHFPLRDGESKANALPDEITQS
jgi:uncharacterized membrane protein